MTLTKKIAYNTIIQVIGRVLSIFFGVVTVGIITRYLGVGGYGMYTKVFTFFQIFGVILDFGLYNVTLKYISHENDEQTELIVNRILTLRLLLNLIFLIVPFFSLLLNYEPIVKQSIFILSLSYLISSIPQILSVVLQKKLNTTPIILGECISRLIYLILVFVIYKSGLGLIEIMIANIIITIVNVLIVYFGAKKYIKIYLIVDWPFFKEVLKNCWPFALSIIFNLIYFRADTFLLTILKSNEDVGIFSAAYKVLEIYISIPSLFVNLILPILDSDYKNNDLDRFNRIVQKTFDFFLIVIIPIIVGGFLLSDNIMTLLAGNSFADSGPVLAVLCVVMGIITMSALYTNTVIAVNEQKKMTLIYFIAAILALILYGIFIPKFSYHAIPYLKIIIEGFVLISAFILTKKHTKQSPSLKNLPKVIFSSLAMGIFIYCFKNFFHQSILLILPMAIVVYFLTLYLIGGIDQNIIRDIIKKE